MTTAHSHARHVKRLAYIRSGKCYNCGRKRDTKRSKRLCSKCLTYNLNFKKLRVQMGYCYDCDAKREKHAWRCNYHHEQCARIRKRCRDKKRRPWLYRDNPDGETNGRARK